MYKGFDGLTKTLDEVAQITAKLYQNNCLNMVGAITSTAATTFAENFNAQYMSILQNEKYILNDIARTLSDPIISNYTSIVSSLCTDVYSSALREILDSVAEITRTIPDTTQIFAEALRNIDFSDVRISEDEILEFEGEELDPTEIETELLNCKEEIATITDEDSAKNFFERHPLIKKLIVLIILQTMLQPVLSEVVVDGVKKAWNENKYAVYTALSEEEQIGIVIVDSAIIREDSSSRSENLGRVLYGDEVVIIGSVPYWYKVQIQDSEGNIIEGYLANRNIDY